MLPLFVIQASLQWLFTDALPLLISIRVLTYSFLPWTDSRLLRQLGGPPLLGVTILMLNLVQALQPSSPGLKRPS